MPNLNESALPSLAGLTETTVGTTAGEIRQLKGYYYQLTEQLRYVLGNLDEENLCAGLQKKIAQNGFSSEFSQSLAQISASVSGQGEQLAAMQLSLGGVQTTVQEQGGQLSTLSQSAAQLQSGLSDAEQNYSSLTQNVSGLTTQVGTAQQELSTLSQTVDGLFARITDSDGKLSTLQQTADSLSLSVENGKDSSVITLSADGLDAQSATLRFTGDVVFKSDLTDGVTAISGDNITTGTLNASLLSTGTIRGKTESSEWSLDDGTFVSGTSAGSHVTMDKESVRWYKDGMLTGVVRSEIGKTYYSACSTYCYLGWCNDEAHGYAYGNHGLYTLPWSGMWGADESMDVSAVVEAGLGVEGALRVKKDIRSNEKIWLENVCAPCNLFPAGYASGRLNLVWSSQMNAWLLCMPVANA